MTRTNRAKKNASKPLTHWSEHLQRAVRDHKHCQNLTKDAYLMNRAMMAEVQFAERNRTFFLDFLDRKIVITNRR